MDNKLKEESKAISIFYRCDKCGLLAHWDHNDKICIMCGGNMIVEEVKNER